MHCDTRQPQLPFFSHPGFLISCFPFVFFPVLTTLVYLSCFFLSPPAVCSSPPFPLLHLTLPLLTFLSAAFFSYGSPARTLTGAEKKKFELTPVAAISVHLLASDGVELQVNEPITVSVPLPADSDLKENDHIPAWRFDPRLGMYNH